MDIKQQIQKWTKLYGRPISKEEYREICENFHGFFTTLRKWEKAEEVKAKERNTKCLNKKQQD